MNTRIAGAVAGIIIALLLGSAIVSPLQLRAQESLSLTVTPPLIQLTIGPGESWSSSLKIVNTNPYEVTYSATVVDFQPKGETGQGSLVPVIEDPDPAQKNYSLAQWVKLPPERIKIAPGATGEVLFSVQVPQNAEPGGHYAAILIGTEPEAGGNTGPSAKISTRVSSLLFVRISGEVVEQGRIREFITKKMLYQSAGAEFLLRFENTGNTHLRPVGMVSVFNMWGKDRGSITINQESNFGNVLPESIRKFEFSWAGESNPFEIGRYSAVATLSYGDELKQNTSATTYFWVVPLLPVGIALASIISVLLLLSWLIRRYIRRALQLERSRSGLSEVAAPASLELSTLIEPLKESVVDLRAVVRQGGVVDMRGSGSGPRPTSVPMRMSPRGFVNKYRLFFLFVLIVVASAIGLSLYLDKVLVSKRTFEITEVSSQEEALPEGSTSSDE